MFKLCVFSYADMMHVMLFLSSQMLSKALLECHEEAQKAGQKLALEVFVCGRNRLENEGATALSEVFEVYIHADMVNCDND